METFEILLAFQIDIHLQSPTYTSRYTSIKLTYIFTEFYVGIIGKYFCFL